MPNEDIAANNKLKKKNFKERPERNALIAPHARVKLNKSDELLYSYAGFRSRCTMPRECK
jgi:hypothetical protein